jgi:hypothetical protein
MYDISLDIERGACEDSPLTLHVRGAGGWMKRIARSGPAHRSEYPSRYPCDRLIEFLLRYMYTHTEIAKAQPTSFAVVFWSSGSENRSDTRWCGWTSISMAK